jgi:hypothetical protein
MQPETHCTFTACSLRHDCVPVQVEGRLSRSFRVYAPFFTDAMRKCIDAQAWDTALQVNGSTGAAASRPPKGSIAHTGVVSFAAGSGVPECPLEGGKACEL